MGDFPPVRRQSPDQAESAAKNSCWNVKVWLTTSPVPVSFPQGPGKYLLLRKQWADVQDANAAKQGIPA